MKENLTEVVFIVDMSGSMQPFTQDTIGGYNNLLKDQKKVKGEANITTVFFDSEYILVHDRVNIKKVKPITEKEYYPRGMTALLDAVGKTIRDIGKKLADMNEADRPSQVIVTIITDGYENASKEYTWKQIQDMIKEQREKYNWLFTFLGANIDVKKVSEDLGVDSRLAKEYSASTAGTNSVYCTMSAAVSAFRKNSSKLQDTADRESVMDEISMKMDENIK